MTNWAEKLPALDAQGLEGLDLTDLCQPWDDNPDVKGVEVDTAIGLDDDLSLIRRATVRSFENLRARPEAVRHLQRLPEDGESLHAIISGRYALWDLVPAIVEKTGRKIDNLHVATLSFSKNNAGEILAMLDAGTLKHITLLVSHYFKGTSPHIYEALIPELIRREQPVAAIRTHAKILLVLLDDGTTYTVESSANLRSCKNVEQFVMTRDRKLYDFHREWMEGIFYCQNRS